VGWAMSSEPRARLVVVGSINVDLAMRLTHLPRPGETIVPGEFVQSLGGKGANVAIAAARLGAKVAIVGAVGGDEYGRSAIADLRACGVAVAGVRVTGAPTGIAMILVDAAGENVIGVAPGANDLVSARDVETAFARIGATRAVVVANLEVPDEAVLASAAAASARGWTFILNPAPPRWLAPELVSACGVMTPNAHEVDRLGYDSAAGLLAAGAGAVVVTLGAQGALLFRPDGLQVQQQAFPCAALDATGAGDAFSAALACGLAEGRSLEESVRRGAAAGAIATQAMGARGGYVRLSEVDRLCQDIAIGVQTQIPHTSLVHQRTGPS
jgi:ribokinase